MKRFVFLTFISIMLIVSGCSNILSTKTSNQNNVINNKVVHNSKEEPKNDAGNTLSTGIKETHEFLDFTIKQSPDNFSFEKYSGNLETVLMYEEGAIKLASKVNASSDILQNLQNALQLTQEAVEEKDFKKLVSANKILEELDTSYNIN